MSRKNSKNRQYQIIAAAAVSIAGIISAAILLAYGISAGWGWMLFISFLAILVL